MLAPKYFFSSALLPCLLRKLQDEKTPPLHPGRDIGGYITVACSPQRGTKYDELLSPHTDRASPALGRAGPTHRTVGRMVRPNESKIAMIKHIRFVLHTQITYVSVRKHTLTFTHTHP